MELLGCGKVDFDLHCDIDIYVVTNWAPEMDKSSDVAINVDKDIQLPGCIRVDKIFD